MFRKFFTSQYAIVFDISLMRYAISNHAIKIRDYHVTVILLCRLHQKSCGIGRNPVVAVEKLKIGTLCLVNRNIPGVFGCKSITDLSGRIVFSCFIWNSDVKRS